MWGEQLRALSAFVSRGPIDVLCCIVADMGRGRAAPLSDLHRPFLGRAVRDRRGRTMPRLRASAVARPSNASADHPASPAARRRCFPAGPDREESGASHPGGGRRDQAVGEQAETSPTGALHGGSLGRLARHLSTPPFDFTMTVLDHRRTGSGRRCPGTNPAGRNPLVFWNDSWRRCTQRAFRHPL